MADYLDDVVAAALQAEKRIATSLGTKSTEQKEESTSLLQNPIANSEQEKSKSETNKLDENAVARRSKKRVRASSKNVSSNWKKLKATLDADASANGVTKRVFRKKRQSKMQKSTLSNPQESASGNKNDSEVGHSQFAKGTVATRDGELTRVIALDCEMVEIFGGTDALARVSIVNVRGDVVYDTFVGVKQRIVNYRTQFSGVTPKDVASGADVAQVRETVGEMLRGRILVGHALRNDLRALALSHPKNLIRDTSLYFKTGRGKSSPKLSFLVAAKLGVDEFQKGSHDSAEDARAALALYKKFGSEWEASLRARTAKNLPSSSHKA